MKAVYIDSQNIHKAIQKLGWIIDWGLFFDYLKNKYKVDQIYMFLGFIKGHINFYETLKNIGFTLIFKEVYVTVNKTVKGNVDIDIALTVSKDFYENSLNSAYLVTADGDYNSLITFMKQKQIFEKLLIPGSHDTSWILTKTAGKQVQDISSLKNILSK